MLVETVAEWSLLYRRERVKRRRAEAAKSDVVEYVLEAAADNAKKLPDLVELSKDLPSGWQVCPLHLFLFLSSYLILKH